MVTEGQWPRKQTHRWKVVVEATVDEGVGVRKAVVGDKKDEESGGISLSLL